MSWKAPNTMPQSGPPTGIWASATLPGNGNETGVNVSAQAMDVVKRAIAKGGDHSNGLIDFQIVRDPNFKSLSVQIDGKPITTYRADANGIVSVDVREQENVIIGGDVNLGNSKAQEFESAWLESEGTNWRTEKDQVIFTNPKTGYSLSLPKLDPGPFCPKNIYPVYGQPGMIFSVAMGLANKRHTILIGPTGTGKTTVYQYVAELLGWNFIRIQIDPKTEGASLIGEYLPAGAGDFRWTDGPLTEAVRMSNIHPTIVVFDELSRIGNVAELARTYSLLDDGRLLTLPERRHELGDTEIIHAGDLYIGATMNPADDEGADYIGVRELDPALMSRFSYSPLIKYPEQTIEVDTLLRRAPGLQRQHAERMVDVATAIRNSEDVHYPFSFRELIAWAEGLPAYGYLDAAKVAFINKAHPLYRPDMQRYVEMTGTS